MASVLALLVGVLGTCVASIVLLRLPGPVARPVPNRWHRKSTPLTGGLALLIGFLLALGSAVLAGQLDRRFGYVALAATAAFALVFATTIVGSGRAQSSLANSRSPGRRRP